MSTKILQAKLMFNYNKKTIKVKLDIHAVYLLISHLLISRYFLAFIVETVKILHINGMRLLMKMREINSINGLAYD
jgi:hypothetical protein